MNVSTILNNLLSVVTPNMHKTRRSALSACIRSLLDGSTASVTGIGRGISTKAREKHCIKRADRLCSNHHLQSKLCYIYGAITFLFSKTSSRPVILVDWSDLDDAKRNFLIRASLVLSGRSLTIYQEVHTIKTKEKPATHKQFLATLNAMLADDSKPIIVTDAGFKAPWFRQVLALGWDYVGRTRLPNFYTLDGQDKWQCISKFYQQATRTPKAFSGSITRYKPHELLGAKASEFPRPC